MTCSLKVDSRLFIRFNPLNFKDEDRVSETKEQMTENINSGRASRRARFSFLDRLRLLEYMVVLNLKEKSLTVIFRRDESELPMTVPKVMKILTTMKKRVTEVVAKCNFLITSSLYSFHLSPQQEAVLFNKSSTRHSVFINIFLDIESVLNGIFTVCVHKNIK